MRKLKLTHRVKPELLAARADWMTELVSDGRDIYLRVDGSYGDMTDGGMYDFGPDHDYEADLIATNAALLTNVPHLIASVSDDE